MKSDTILCPICETENAASATHCEVCGERLVPAGPGGSDGEAVDVSGVEPMTAVIPNKLRLREDEVTEGGIRDAVLMNAPAAEHGFFAVPKVIE